MNEIKNVIESVKPHLLVICEGNLRLSVNEALVQKPGYDLFRAQTIHNSDIKNISRVLVYKHSSVIGKVRTDLMSNSVDIIWLEIGLKNHKKLLVGSLYRVW